MEKSTTKLGIIIIICVTAFLINQFLIPKSDKNNSSTNIVTRSGETKKKSIEFEDMKEVMVFRKSSLQIEKCILDENNNIYLSILETRQDREENMYDFNFINQDKSKLDFSVVTEETLYDENDNLYYTNYHFSILNPQNSSVAIISYDGLTFEMPINIK